MEVFEAAVASGVQQFCEEREKRKKEIESRLGIRKSRVRDMSNPFVMDPQCFCQLYRLTPRMAMDLIEMIKDKILIYNGTVLPVHIQVLRVLQFLADGREPKISRGEDCILDIKMCLRTSTRCINNVVNAIVLLRDKFIKMPKTQEERTSVSNGYNRIKNILGVIGCFQVSIRVPYLDPNTYYNNNCGYCLNVHVVVDSNGIFQNVIIRPGTNTPRFIWNQSQVKKYLTNLRNDKDVVAKEGKYYILGNNSYTLSPVLLTPIFGAPEGSPQYNYTNEFAATWFEVEKSFTNIRHTWKIFRRSRNFHYQPIKASKLILACIILHNFRKLNGLDDDCPETEVPYCNDIFSQGTNMNCDNGVEERNSIIEQYYCRNIVNQ